MHGDGQRRTGPLPIYMRELSFLVAGEVLLGLSAHVNFKPALKALEFLSPGNANARAEITAFTEITGRSWKCYLKQEWKT